MERKRFTIIDGQTESTGMVEIDEKELTKIESRHYVICPVFIEDKLQAFKVVHLDSMQYREKTKGPPGVYECDKCSNRFNLAPESLERCPNCTSEDIQKIGN